MLNYLSGIDADGSAANFIETEYSRILLWIKTTLLEKFNHLTINFFHKIDVYCK